MIITKHNISNTAMTPKQHCKGYTAYIHICIYHAYMFNVYINIDKLYIYIIMLVYVCMYTYNHIYMNFRKHLQIQNEE